MNYFLLIIGFLSLSYSYAMQEKAQPSPLQHMVIGLAAAGVEVAFDHPLFTLKNKMQCNKRIEYSLSGLYRGAAVNFASLAPVTAIQVATYGLLNSIIGEMPSAFNSFGAAYAAGMVSSIVSGPSEAFMLQQQITKSGAANMLRTLRSEGNLWNLKRGMAPTALRDGGFSAGYLFLGNKMQELLGWPGALGAGLVAATLTHPFDTIKTVMQKDLSSSKNMVATMGTIIKEEGLQGLYKGFTPRATRVTSAIILMGETTKRLSQRFSQESQEA